MNSSFKIIAIEQGTQEWYEWRRMGIGASDAPIITGENRFTRINELIEQKINPFYIDGQTIYMKKGKELEPVARNTYIQKTGNIVYPTCIESTKYNWLKASLDGLNTVKELVIEIKCGEKAYKHASLHKRIPRYYYAQAQHILAITEYDHIDFWFYWPGMQEILIKVQRDDAYINRLLEKEYIFWNKIKDDIKSKHFYYQEYFRRNNNIEEYKKTGSEVAKNTPTQDIEKSKTDARPNNSENTGCSVFIIVMVLIYIIIKLLT